ncbi:MAG: GNAT family N-acetyltransferase [Alphaproteobacteria bacterium]|nr:GNAT family N-acetyltransferase [Alphaproteobacteria bacterium]
MITQLTVRKAHIAEAARLGMLAHKAWERDLMGFFTDGGNWRRQMATDLVLYCVGATGDIVVADRQGEAIGWGARERNYIPYLWVTPGWQGRGTGSQILGRLEQDMAASGFASCVLDTLAAHKRAIRFYAGHGYKITQKGEMPTRTGGQRIEKVRMVKVLATAGTGGH